MESEREKRRGGGGKDAFRQKEKLLTPRMQRIRAPPSLHRTHLDTKLVDLEHGLVEVFLRFGKGAGDGEGSSAVGNVGVELAAWKNERGERDEERMGR